MSESWQGYRDNYRIKKKGSRNYCKKKKQIALFYEKITNTRKDYLHKISHEIINENQVIVSENLQVKIW